MTEQNDVDNVGIRNPDAPAYRELVVSDIAVRDEPRAEGTTGQVLTGHFARFNEWTEINSAYEGHFMERFQPGAFKKTLKERADKLRVLFQHGRDPAIGDKVIASINMVREDDQGAYYEASLLDGLPDLLVSGLRAGQYGASFRFRTVIENQDMHPERSDFNPDGIPERTIREAHVMEFGPVTFPAYGGATAGIRSITDEILFGDLVKDPERLRALVDVFTPRTDAKTVVVNTIHPGGDPETLAAIGEAAATGLAEADRTSPQQDDKSTTVEDEALRQDGAGHKAHSSRGSRDSRPLYGLHRKEQAWRL